MTTPAPLTVWTICQHYVPEVGAPSARLSGLLQSWRQAGINAVMLTGIPNHPEGVVHPDYKNKPANMKETLSGVPVWRHWLYVAPNKGKWPRLFNQLSFALSLLVQHLGGTAEKPHIIMASSPTFFPALSGWLLAKRYGARFVFEVRDLWPAIFVQMGLFRAGSFPVRVMEVLEKFLYRQAHAIVTVTQSFKDDIAARGTPTDKIHVVFNGVSEESLAAAAAVRQADEGAKLRQRLGIPATTKIVLYIGNHGQAQALGQIIDAARLLSKRTDLTFLMVGQGADKEKLQAYAKGVPNVQFLPGVSHAEVWAYYTMADINLVCLKNIPEFAMFIPSKMFEIMAAQSCAVAALSGEGAAIMQASGCALVAPSEDSEKIATAIATLADDPARRQTMGQAGRAFVEKNFTHTHLAHTYLNLFQSLVAK